MKREAIRIGDTLLTQDRLIPKRDADQAVRVISFSDFRKGELDADVKYNWRLSWIRDAVFVKLMSGPNKGKVSMFSADCLK